MIRKRVLGSVLAGILAISCVSCKKEEKVRTYRPERPPETPKVYEPEKPPVVPQAPEVPEAPKEIPEAPKEEETPPTEVPPVEEAPKEPTKGLEEGVNSLNVYVGRSRVLVTTDKVRERFYMGKDFLYNDLRVGRKFDLQSMIGRDRGIDIRFKIGKDSYVFDFIKDIN